VLWCLVRVLTWRRFVKLARNASRATVRPVDGGAVHALVQPDVDALLMAGLTLEASTTTELPELPTEHTAHLVDPTCPLVVRVMCVDGFEANGASISALSWYPGGFLATSRLSSQPVRAEEVLQTFPDASPLEVVFRHREAVAALRALGTEPVAVPTDLGAALQADWRGDGAAMLGLGFAQQVAMSKATSAPAAAHNPLRDRPDLQQIAGRLALPG
jgi:hypothetical protein